MKWDELMDTLDKFDCAGMIDEPLVRALRLIVEMHQQYEDPWFGNGLICQECSKEEYTAKYPCDTIEAIEKALQ